MNTPREKKLDNNRNLRTILIDPFKQIKFGIYMIAVTTLFVAASGGLFLHSFVTQYQHVMGLFNVVDPAMKWDFVVNDVFYSNAIRIAVVYALFMLMILVLVFRLTHRYYGPLVSIERFIKEITEGRYDARVSIRQKDELQNLVKNLNSMAEVLEQRHRAPNSNEKK